MLWEAVRVNCSGWFLKDFELGVVIGFLCLVVINLSVGINITGCGGTCFGFGVVSWLTVLLCFRPE